MADHSSTSAIVKAIVGNGLVAIAKFIAFLTSRSGAMLAETVHSVVDTLNQCLLLIGQKRANRPPTDRFPYGFGPEANFWGVLAAVGILIFGGGLSILHAFEAFAHPHVPDNLPLVFVVLAIGTIIETWVLYSIFTGLKPTKGDRSWLTHVKKQASGTIFVIVEDAAAVLGCIIAAIAIALSAITHNGLFDALAQLVIGLMLFGVGLFLLWRNRGALIGQSLPADRMATIREFLEGLDGIDRITDLKTRQLTAHTYQLKCEVVFSGGWLAQRLMEEYGEKLASASDPKAIRATLGRYSDKLFVEQALHVDRLEAEIRSEFPGAEYIDLEPHLKDI